MKKYSKLFVLIIVFFNLTSHTVYSNQNIDRYMQSGILIDKESSRVLYEKDSSKQVPIASLTKIMTLLIALEAIENNQVSENDIVNISNNSARLRGSTYNLKKGEQVELIELLKALMIVSGNDAAVAIAEHIAETEDNFVKLMNNKAREIGMHKTLFFNCHGLPIYNLNNPDDRIENLSSAKDLSILVKYLLDNYYEETLKITSIKDYSNPSRNFQRSNTNPLMDIFPEVDGLKTGYTGMAGYCLAFTAPVKATLQDEGDFRLIGITLGSSSQNERVLASKNLLEYGKNNFVKTKVLSKGEVVSTRYLFGSEYLSVNVVSEDEIWVIRSKNENINKEIKLSELSFPVRKGDLLGELVYTGENGDILGKTNLLSNTDIVWIPIKAQLDIVKRSILRLFSKQ
ncbi:D-alanyl-D-alanine carboxypeptidase [Alkalithermobacter thermoalcaliphilus JW-YL-7 = DSM 7308]|uniref:serine-type D-Ala-D-Ala carboxypeptidase n=1 Tax=Alkalithermobacter thermoalcaliphilus JW-YL-7 = DSM 7308 TaxID=1121328 RepID=A0A150FQ19_CLOPD|nr:Serine-type D-Ala-D-Ala carboxypeptidase [[Clostridium] paradoxum JW-YL-7 = DSM 7308]SHK63762.1 D-alanyl-D-alanine carboxypeptidase [[Clostridium] paradoxum JW-YL-7 = DSM 7308]